MPEKLNKKNLPYIAKLAHVDTATVKHDKDLQTPWSPSAYSILAQHLGPTKNCQGNTCLFSTRANKSHQGKMAKYNLSDICQGKLCLWKRGSQCYFFFYYGDLTYVTTWFLQPYRYNYYCPQVYFIFSSCTIMTITKSLMA